MRTAIDKQQALTALTVGLPVAVALILRLYDLGGESIWLDEAVSIAQSRGGFVDMIALTAEDNYPPLHNITLFFSMRVFGPTELGARLPSAVFGTLTVLVGYLIGKQLFGRRAGLAAAWLLALSVFHIEYSQEARMYAIFALLAGLSYLFFIRFLEQPRSPAAWYYAASTALMLYTHYYGLFLLFAQNLFMLIDLVTREAGRGARLRRWIVLQVVVVLAFTPWLPTLYRGTADVQEGFWIDPPTWDGFWNVFSTYAGGDYAAWASAAAIVALVGLMLLGRGSQSGADPGTDGGALTAGSSLAMLGLWLLVPIVTPILLSLFLQPFFFARYTIAASVAWYLVVGAGLARIAAGRIWALVPLVGLMVGLSSPAVVDYYRNLDKPDWRAAAAILRDNASDSDLFIVTPPWARWGLGYYFGNSDRITGSPRRREYLNAAGIWTLSLDMEPCPDGIRGGRRLILERQLANLTICQYGGLLGG